TELGDDCGVAVAIMLAQVVEQARPLADHHEQAAARRVVLLVRAHVLVQLVDAGREQRDLHFRRPGIFGIAAELVDDLRLAVLGNRHLDPHRLRLPRLLLYVQKPFSTYYPSILFRLGRDCKGQTNSAASVAAPTRRCCISTSPAPPPLLPARSSVRPPPAIPHADGCAAPQPCRTGS